MEHLEVRYNEEDDTISVCMGYVYYHLDYDDFKRLGHNMIKAFERRADKAIESKQK